MQYWCGGTDGFTLSNSEVNDSGIIGLYLGHIDFAPTRNVTIANNKFLRSRTNAIAIEGVVGDVGGGYSNNISWNTISGNHWEGQFLVGGTISGGGQVLLGAGDHISFDNNTIADGFCSSCWANFVPGVEIGFASRAYTLSDTSISNNKIYNNNGDPIVVSTWDGSRADSSVQVTGNFMINNETPFGSLRVDGAFQSGNTLKDYIKQIGWESEDDFPAGWNSWQTCSDGGQLVRWNAGSDAMQGTFALRMVSGEMAPCGGEGLWMQGVNTPISPGDTVYVSSWVRNGGWKGALCIVAADSSLTEIASSCQSFSPDPWTYDANPLVGFKMPAAAKYFQVKVGLQSANAYADLDNVRLTW